MVSPNGPVGNALSGISINPLEISELTSCHSLQHDLRAQIPALISCLISHKIYSSFEEYYINITSEFYVTESTKLAESMAGDPKGFFKHAYQRIEEENKRSQDVLPIGSWSLVREKTERALWSGRLEWLATGSTLPFSFLNFLVLIISSALSSYITSKDFTTLATMYSLFSRVDGVKVLVNAFIEYIRTTVQTIVKDKANDEDMVQRLLDFKSLADSAVHISFLDDKINVHGAPPPTPSSTSAAPPRTPNPDFTYALTDAFTLGFKARRNKPAEMIAKYVDKAMRRGQGATTDAVYEALLDAVLGLYRYTEDKDVFRTFYHRMLAKRLLLGKTASDDFEKGMLKKLKEGESLFFFLLGNRADFWGICIRL